MKHMVHDELGLTKTSGGSDEVITVGNETLAPEPPFVKLPLWRTTSLANSESSVTTSLPLTKVRPKDITDTS